MADPIVVAANKVVKLPIDEKDFEKVHTFTADIKGGTIRLHTDEEGKSVVSRIHKGESVKIMVGVPLYASSLVDSAVTIEL